MERTLLLTSTSTPGTADALAGLAGALTAAGLPTAVLPLASADPDPGGTVVVVVWSDTALLDADEERLLALAERGLPVLLLGPTVAAARGNDRLLEAAGVSPGAVMPRHEIRVRPGRGEAAARVTARLAGDLVVTDRWPLVDKTTDDTEVLLTANSAFTDHPVATRRGSLATFTVGTEAATLSDPAYRRIVSRLLRELLGRTDAAPVRVGILGYGAIGHEHNAAIQAVEGLELAAVCDTDPRRVAAARTLAPGLESFVDGEAMLASDAVDLVIVSTPPASHADWAVRTLEAGKHCVVEKPFCITVAEADRQIAVAAERGLSLSVYQNRRWDADFLALKRVWQQGLLGEVFHYESFIGSYGHPCNYWHSDEAVSGGAIYDWGSHYLDWLLHLMPGDIDFVTAAAHKRVWHDVTNADHSRVTVRFAGGAEAEFTHSDLAAAMKPKFYVLGTEGAVVGSWRDEKVVARSSIGTLSEDLLAASDSPARMALHHPDGSVTALAVPPPPPQPFHRELADSLLAGAPMSVTPEGSRRNIAVMQAAALSAADGGRPQALPAS